MTNSPRESFSERYARLWAEAVEPVRRGEVRPDPLLARRMPDQRRGLTVLARPSNTIRQSVGDFLQTLRAVDPHQYYYDPAELHVTLLSLFTATIEVDRYLVHYKKYAEAVRAALAGVPAFEIEFTGVTLTLEAVMIQGYPQGTILNDTREALRRELRARGLTEGLDARYRLETAHMTVVRYRAHLSDIVTYVHMLEQFRQHPFGRTSVQELNLVSNDWYMSKSVVEVRERYQLSSGSVPQASQPA